jgi:hypothetical protein
MWRRGRRASISLGPHVHITFAGRHGPTRCGSRPAGLSLAGHGDAGTRLGEHRGSVRPVMDRSRCTTRGVGFVLAARWISPAARLLSAAGWRPAEHTNDHCARGPARGRKLTMINEIVERMVTDGSTGGAARRLEHNRGTARRPPVARLLDVACSAWRWCSSPGPISAPCPWSPSSGSSSLS